MSRPTLEKANESMYGSQPDFDYTGVTDIMFYNAKAFDWFNANMPSSKKRECLAAYAKTTGKPASVIDAVSALDLSDILFCHAIYAKMAANGAKLHPNHTTALEEAFSQYVTRGNSKLRATGGKVTTDVQSFIKDRLVEYSANINMELDRFITQGFVSDFNPEAWIAENEVKGVYCTKIVETILRPLFNELACVVETTDMSLVEGWSHITTTQARDLAKFAFRLIDVFEGRVEVAKAERLPRVKKPKPAIKQVKALKYKKIDETFKITSISPTKIVGATELYVFNTKTRAMICFFADDAKGFAVKGSTLLGVDEKKSFSKTLRKPSETFPVVLKNGSRAITKEMESIRAVAKPVKNRINKDMILMRAI